MPLASLPLHAMWIGILSVNGKADDDGPICPPGRNAGNLTRLNCGGVVSGVAAEAGGAVTDPIRTLPSSATTIHFIPLRIFDRRSPGGRRGTQRKGRAPQNAPFAHSYILPPVSLQSGPTVVIGS